MEAILLPLHGLFGIHVWKILKDPLVLTFILTYNIVLFFQALSCSFLHPHNTSASPSFRATAEPVLHDVDVCCCFHAVDEVGRMHREGQHVGPD